MGIRELKERMGPHFSRWLVAVILLPPLIWSVVAEESVFFFILILVIGALGWWEFWRAFLGDSRVELLVLGILGWAAVGSGAYYYGPPGQSAGLVVAISLGAGYTMWGLGRESGPVLLNLLGRFSLGHLYLSFLLSFALLLKKINLDGLWLLYALGVTIIADTFAFYVGSKIKGPKLWAKISPNKTISGLLGGAVGAMIFSALCATFLPAPSLHLALMGLFLGFWGAFGDLFESCLKRAMNIKDTSGILMGHGGVLDRLDAILFNIVIVYVMADHFINSVDMMGIAI